MDGLPKTADEFLAQSSGLGNSTRPQIGTTQSFNFSLFDFGHDDCIVSASSSSSSFKLLRAATGVNISNQPGCVISVNSPPFVGLQCFRLPPNLSCPN